LVVALRGIVVALLLVVDLADLALFPDTVDNRLLVLSPKPRGAEAEVDKGGGDVNRLCEDGGGAVTVNIWGVT
jgi:hypothetical protein